MSVGQVGLGVAAISGFLTIVLGALIPKSPPVISVNSIEIFSDGTTTYDRTTKDGKWIAWSGQLFDGDVLVCRGGDLSQYFQDSNPLDTQDIWWLISADCPMPEEGMTYVFNWTPLDPAYSPVRYPAHGLGVVKAPN